MRITTNSIMRNYNNRLNKVLNNLNIANQKVTSKRKFLSASESPAEAARAYQLRRQMQKNDDYISNVKDVQDTLASVESSLMEINKMANSVYDSILRGDTGTMGAPERKQLAEDIRGMQQSILMDVNAQFEGRFMFGGGSVNELPFELKTVDGEQKLYYRGIDVESDDPADQAKLNELANEAIYVDLGFGLDITTNVNGTQTTRDVTAGSAFDTALPGIRFLGYGKDANGLSNNLILNMGKIADALEAEPYDSGALKPLSDKLDEQRTTVLTNITNLGTKSSFLTTTLGRLEDNAFNLNSKIVNVEYVDLAEAISDFKEWDYTYRAALKMGMDILSPSFIDFMK